MAETVAQLLLEEIIPRYSTPLHIVTDNGSENINRVMKHTLQEINIRHVTTSYFHPQGNSKTEDSTVCYMMSCQRRYVIALVLGH